MLGLALALFTILVWSTLILLSVGVAAGRLTRRLAPGPRPLLIV